MKQLSSLLSIRAHVCRYSQLLDLHIRRAEGIDTASCSNRLAVHTWLPKLGDGEPTTEKARVSISSLDYETLKVLSTATMQIQDAEHSRILFHIYFFEYIRVCTLKLAILIP